MNLIKNVFNLKIFQKIILILSVSTLTLAFFFNHSLAFDARREVRSNGLVLLHSEQHNLPIVKVTLLIKASPLNETPEKAGLASLTADLLTEGTETRSSEEISEEIEFIGAEISASTDVDYTMISLSVLKKDIEKGFELFSDILLNPAFPEKEIERIKMLIKGSLKQREEDPGFIAERRFRKIVYGEHPYGRLVEGDPGTIDSITREDIVRFYESYYRPNNAILAVVGDLSYEEVDQLLRKYLAAWARKPVPEEMTYSIPDLGKSVFVSVDRDLTQANIILGHIGIERSNPDYYAVSVMNYILGGGGFASRIMNRIRDDLGLAYDVHSFYSSDRYRGVFQAGVQTKNESAKAVIGLLLEEIERIRKEPVSDEELADAKSFLTGSFPRRLDTMGKIASFLALTEFYDLGIDYDRRYPEYINSVTKEEIIKVAKKYLHPERYVLVIVADMEKTGLGTEFGRQELQP